VALVSAAVFARLPDGRLHLQHGPIDVIVEGWGERDEVEAAYSQAWIRFRSVLDELVAELPRLREPVGGAYPLLRGRVAKRMAAAVWPHRAQFITPMAAVAGAVADELMEALLQGRNLRKAYVNDGGDIALHLAPGEHLRAGVVGDVSLPAIDALASVASGSPVRGIATSGWRGRSQSLGIADAATILARSAAEADAAATLVANAADADHPAIQRRPARAVKEDSDLGERLVTVAVGPLPRALVRSALERGTTAARSMHARGLLEAAYLSLQGETALFARRDCLAFNLPLKLWSPP
jgi:ApbE superfamily uncharacterized protein (UPF0280 family)